MALVVGLTHPYRDTPQVPEKQTQASAAVQLWDPGQMDNDIGIGRVARTSMRIYVWICITVGVGAYK